MKRLWIFEYLIRCRYQISEPYIPACMRNKKRLFNLHQNFTNLSSIFLNLKWLSSLEFSAVVTKSSSPVLATGLSPVTQRYRRARGDQEQLSAHAPAKPMTIAAHSYPESTFHFTSGAQSQACAVRERRLEVQDCDDSSRLILMYWKVCGISTLYILFLGGVPLKPLLPSLSP